MSDADPDDGLLAATARGDARAFAVLVERHADRVQRYAYAVLASQAEAEDVTQEVFVTLWQKAGAWQAGRARLSTWLFQITRNAALNYRSRVRGREDAWDDDLPEPVADVPGPEDVIARADEQARLAAAIAALPSTQQCAMTLVYGEGLSNKDAAAALDVSVKALEALLVRARRQLRSLLGAPTMDGGET